MGGPLGTTGPDMIGELRMKVASGPPSRCRTGGAGRSAGLIPSEMSARESDRTSWQRCTWWEVQSGLPGDSMWTGVRASSASRIASAGPSADAVPMWNRPTQVTPKRRRRPGSDRRMNKWRHPRGSEMTVQLPSVEVNAARLRLSRPAMSRPPGVILGTGHSTRSRHRLTATPRPATVSGLPRGGAVW